VGSFYNTEKELEKFNDFDIVLIFETITKKEIEKINKVASLIKDKFSNRSIGITHTLKIGPIKVKSEKEKTIMLHFLTYSVNGYNEYESVLTRFSFQNYKPLLGISLSKISKIKKIDYKDLFNKIDGIPAMKNWIIKNEVEYIEPTKNGIKIIPKNLGDKEHLEIVFYSVLRLASNILRVKGRYFDVDKDMCNEFSKNFKMSSNNLPKEIFNLKESLRKGRLFSRDEIKILSGRAIIFIEECERLLKSDN